MICKIVLRKLKKNLHFKKNDYFCTTHIERDPNLNREDFINYSNFIFTIFYNDPS